MSIPSISGCTIVQSTFFHARAVIGGGNTGMLIGANIDQRPCYTASIMEFGGDKVTRETQYFADPFEAGAWRAQWAERMYT